MEARALQRALPLVLAGALFGCVESRPPSVILITVDTLRADHVGCYGYFRNTTPVIDRFAGEGVLFERAITVMATTLPAHASLLTATYPARHGVMANLDAYHQPVPTSDEDFQSVAQMFERAGYDTAAFVSVYHLGPQSGMAAGFRTFDGVPGTHGRQPLEMLMREANLTTDRAIAWLDSAARTPFFLWVHYFDPHSPYRPPPDFARFRSGEELERFVQRIHVPAQRREQSLRIHDSYDGEVLFTDHEIGRLFEALKRLGHYDDSMIIFTADHGEGLWQHDVAEHGVIYNEQNFVPLILRFPDGRGPSGIRLPEVASLVDVFPTVVETLDLPLPTTQFDGINLLARKREHALTEREHKTSRFGLDRQLTLTGPRFKYSYHTREPDALYDLQADFGETRNVIGRHPEVAEQMKRELLDVWHESRERGSGLDVRRDPSPELIDALRSLGYVE